MAADSFKNTEEFCCAMYIFPRFIYLYFYSIVVLITKSELKLESVGTFYIRRKDVCFPKKLGRISENEVSNLELSILG